MQARVGAVYAEQLKRDLMLSVWTVYSPRQRSEQAPGIPWSRQQGRWSLPSAMQLTMFGKSASHCVGLVPTDNVM